MQVPKEARRKWSWKWSSWFSCTNSRICSLLNTFSSLPLSFFWAVLQCIYKNGLCFPTRLHTDNKICIHIGKSYGYILLLSLSNSCISSIACNGYISQKNCLLFSSTNRYVKAQNIGGSIFSCIYCRILRFICSFQALWASFQEF